MYDATMCESPIVSTRPTEWKQDLQDEQAIRGLSSLLPHPVQAFGHSALFEEATVELAQLLVEQVVGLINQADQAVGSRFSAARLDVRPVSLVRPVRCPRQPPDGLDPRVVFALGGRPETGSLGRTATN